MVSALPLPSQRPVAPPRKADRRLVDLFFGFFEVLPAKTRAILEETHRIRYQIYCMEHAYEDPAENPGGLESDPYDAHSAHCLLRHRGTGWPAGTVRLILPLEDKLEASFPIQEVCGERISHLPLATTAEVSRFSIAKTFRRRRGDGSYPGNFQPLEWQEDARRVIPNMMLGLVTAALRMSQENGITHWCNTMEPALIRMLSRQSLYFDKVGAPIEFHGKRQPCAIAIADFVARCKAEKPEIWEVITEDGRWVDF